MAACSEFASRALHQHGSTLLPVQVPVPAGTPGAGDLPVQAGSWWAAWLRARLTEATNLARRDPQKLLERAIQLSFTANAAIQARMRMAACAP